MVVVFFFHFGTRLIVFSRVFGARLCDGIIFLQFSDKPIRAGVYFFFLHPLERCGMVGDNAGL